MAAGEPLSWRRPRLADPMLPLLEFRSKIPTSMERTHGEPLACSVAIRYHGDSTSN